MGKTALVLTDNPAAISASVDDAGINCINLPTTKLLIKALVDEIDCEGIILDVRLVMDTPANERDKLFTLAGETPIVRCRISPEEGTVNYLDALDCITGACSLDMRNQRIEDRVRVRLDACWALDNDPTMSESYEAVLLDLSSGGAFLHAPYVLPKEDFLNLRILELSNKRPIQCAVRWRKETAGPGQFVGVGLKFMDLTKDQLSEIRTRCLTEQRR